MNYGKNKHYQNKHGQELNEFLKATISPEEMVAWYMLQSLKYNVRAGKKEHESEVKDLDKSNDYLGEWAKLTGNDKELLFKYIQDLKEEFEEWEGEK